MTMGLLCLIPVVLSILFFIWIPSDRRGIVEWLSFMFMLLSFAAVCLFIPKRSSDEVFPLAAGEIAMKYFIFQLVASLVFILLSQMLAWYDNAFRTFPCLLTLTIFMILAVIFAVRVGIHAMADRSTSRSVNEQNILQNFKNGLHSSIASLITQTKDDEAVQALQRLQEAMRFIPFSRLESPGFMAELQTGVLMLAEAVTLQDWTVVTKSAERLVLACRVENEH